MTRSTERRGRAGAFLAVLVIALAGCPDDPDKASSWTKKLSDPKEAERAVAKLDDLGDPSAIDDLGALWREKKDGRILQVIIGLAKPLTAKQAQDLFKADYETSGRPANWDKALPYLTEALTGVSEDSQRSTESAMKAAEALGDAQLGIDALIDVASRPVTKKLVGVQTSAIHAMGKFAAKPEAKAKAAQALVKIIDRDPPPLPFSTADKEKQRALADDFTIYQKMTAASILALSELRVPDATKALVRVMYKAPSLFAQVRRALVASGPSAEEELRKILRGENSEVNQLFKD